MEDYKSGHRDRMKKKYAEQGAGAFYDYQLLEMLLFYAIPRKDVKPIAKELLEKFGSMDNLLTADIQQISSVKGVGESTALLIKLVADINKNAIDGREKQIPVRSVKQASEYFKKLLENETKERFAVMLLDNGSKLQYSGIIGEGTFGMAEVPMKTLTRLVSDHHATGLIIAHNHPKGFAEPSDADIDITLVIRDFMKKLDVSLRDHIIIGANGVYSMRSDLRYNHYFHK